MDYSPSMFYVLFISVITIGGSLGGFLQGMRSQSSYKIRWLMISSPEADTRVAAKKPREIDLGFIGFIVAGVISAYLSIGTLTAAGSVDLRSISQIAYSTDKDASDIIQIPKQLFANGHHDHSEQIAKIVEVIVAHNSNSENNSAQLKQDAFWTWCQLFSLSILCGFGGVSVVTSAYNKYVGKDKFEETVQDIRKELEEEHRRSVENSVDTMLQRAREFLQSDQPDEAIKLCQSVLEQRPNKARAFGLMAKAYRQKGHIGKAIQTLDDALSQAECQENAVIARLHWNLACYKLIMEFGSEPSGLNDINTTNVNKEFVQEIRLHLESAIRFDSHLRTKLSKDEDLKFLEKFARDDYNWILELAGGSNA